MHGIIICRRIGFQGVAFIAAANKYDEKSKGKKGADSGSHGKTITNGNAIYYELLLYLWLFSQ
jgi:hypothetical protein